MKPITAIVLLSSGLMLQDPAFSQMKPETSPGVLRGLSTVDLRIDYEGPAEAPAGLTAEQLRSEVQVRLSLAGLRVLDDRESTYKGDVGHLYLRVQNIPLDEHARNVDSFCFSVSLGLLQNVILADNRHLSTRACTWSEGHSIIVPQDSLRRVTEAVGDLAFDFAHAVEAANTIQEPEVDVTP